MGSADFGGSSEDFGGIAAQILGERAVQILAGKKCIFWRVCSAYSEKEAVQILGVRSVGFAGKGQCRFWGAGLRRFWGRCSADFGTGQFNSGGAAVQILGEGQHRFWGEQCIF